MKKRLSAKLVRKIFNFLLVFIWLSFFGFGGFLYMRFNNALSETPKTEESRDLLSNFNSGKFDVAIDRLKKRRGLSDSPPVTKDPFGKLDD